MIGARPFLAAVFLAALALTPAGPGRSAEQSEIPDQVRAYALWQQGYLLHLNGRYQAAVDSFRESIEILPTAEGHTFLGWSLSMLGHIEASPRRMREGHRARSGLRQSLQRYRSVPDGARPPGRGGAVVREGDSSAKRYCCYQFAHFNLGHVRLKQGDYHAAKRSFEEALRHDPDYLPARMALEYLEAEIGIPL